MRRGALEFEVHWLRADTNPKRQRGFFVFLNATNTDGPSRALGSLATCLFLRSLRLISSIMTGRKKMNR